MTGEQTIVVVDKDENIVSAFRGFLAREGVCMVPSPSAAAASAMLETRTADLLIIDIGIPVDLGLNFVRDVRRKHPSLPIIAITGYTESVSEREVKALGASFFFAKPLDLDRLRDAVRRSLPLKHVPVNRFR